MSSPIVKPIKLLLDSIRLDHWCQTSSNPLAKPSLSYPYSAWSLEYIMELVMIFVGMRLWTRPSLSVWNCKGDVSAIGINFNEIIYMHQPEVFVDNFWILSAYLFDRFHQRWFTSIIWLKTVRCSFFYKNGKMASFTIFVEVDDVFSFSTSNVENDHYRIRTQLQI